MENGAPPPPGGGAWAHASPVAVPPTLPPDPAGSDADTTNSIIARYIWFEQEPGDFRVQVIAALLSEETKHSAQYAKM